MTRAFCTGDLHLNERSSLGPEWLDEQARVWRPICELATIEQQKENVYQAAQGHSQPVCEDSGLEEAHCYCERCERRIELRELIRDRRLAKARVQAAEMDERVRESWLADLDADIRRYREALTPTTSSSAK